MSWLFDTRAGQQTLRPFSYLAFRYLEVDGANEPLTADSIRVAARHAAMPDENAAAFTSSNATLNAVWNLARHSRAVRQPGAIPRHADARERAVPRRRLRRVAGDDGRVRRARPHAQALRDFARSQKRYWPDGRVNVVYPNGDGKRDIPDATESYVEWVWQSYPNSGNRDQLAALYATVTNITNYVARAIDPRTGLVTKLPGGGEDYLYGAVDWPPWMRYGYDMTTTARTTVNVLAVDDFRRAAAIAQALGRPASEVQQQQSRADALTRAMQSKLERPDGVFVDGLLASGKQSAHAGQQANVWPLAFGIVPAAHTRAVADHIVAEKNAMGVVYFRVLLDALHSGGPRRRAGCVAHRPQPSRIRADLEARRHIHVGELGRAAVGDSESHGWGSTVLAVLLDDVLGVHPTAPGGAHLEMRVPHTSVTSAQGRIATQRGPVTVSWQRGRVGPRDHRHHRAGQCDRHRAHRRPHDRTRFRHLEPRQRETASRCRGTDIGKRFGAHLDLRRSRRAGPRGSRGDCGCDPPPASTPGVIPPDASDGDACAVRTPAKAMRRAPTRHPRRRTTARCGASRRASE